MVAPRISKESGYVLYYTPKNDFLPETQERLVELLVRDEAREFIRCLAGHFDDLAKFIPVIAKLFQKEKRNGR
jgi:hypothetical protein